MTTDIEQGTVSLGGSYWSVQHAVSCRLLSAHTHTNRNIPFHIFDTSVTIDPSLQG